MIVDRDDVQFSVACANNSEVPSCLNRLCPRDDLIATYNQCLRLVFNGYDVQPGTRGNKDVLVNNMDAVDVPPDGGIANLNRSGWIRYGEDSYASFAIGAISTIVDNLDISEADREKIYVGNAEKLFGVTLRD